jgi:Phage capsid protein
MSENLPKLAVETFSTVLKLKLQQTRSMLRGRAEEGQHVGKAASPVDYIGDIQMKAPAGRFAPNQPQNTDFSRRWVLPVDKEGYQLIDTFDKLRLLQDPTSRYSDVAAAAVAREWDDRLIASAFAVATIGDSTGTLLTTTESFSTTYWQIASTFKSTAASGLTVAKMIEAKRVMRKAQVPVDEETRTWVTNSQGESDLLNQVQVVSTEFSDKPVLQDGKVTRFLGWDIIYSERLTSTSNVRQNIACVKSGWYLGIWKDTENDLDRRRDLSGLPWQLATLMSSGATRLEPGRLLQVLCADTSAASDVTP